MRRSDDDVDFKHLLAFDQIYRCGSISDAALALGVSQPSVSLMLSKLRKHFDDRLFVRTQSGMQPTPRAKALSAPVREALNAFHRAATHTDDFVPETSQIVFRISMTDIGQVVMLPLLARRLRELAPNTTLYVTNTTVDSHKRLASDDLDLAFGSVSRLPPSCFQKNLFKEYFVCISSLEHPRIGRTITVDRYLDEHHVTITSAGTGAWMVESAVDRLVHKRKIVFEIPTFFALAEIVESTDLIATVPVRLAEVLARNHRIKVLSLPIKIPSYDVKQYWHERQHNNPANKWLRGLVTNIITLNLAKLAN